jgi:hypothetical protein
MKKEKIFFVVICALAVCLALGFAVTAWVGPDGNPPDSNIAAPINAGDMAQYKTGGLGMKIGGAITYWISQVGNNLVFKTGNDFATAVETMNINTDGRIGNVSAPIDDKDAVNKAYLDAQSGAGGTGYGTCVGAMLDIKFTAATYDGDLDGITGADAKCAAEYPDYHFCQYAEFEKAKLTGCLPLYDQYWLVSGWYDSAKSILSEPSNCNNWEKDSMGWQEQKSYLFGNYGLHWLGGGWMSEDGGGFGINYDYCEELYPLACCREI